MVAVSASTSEFSRLFKDEFSRLFKRPKRNADTIKAKLIEMVNYIVGGWKFPNEHVKEDVRQDAIAFVLDPVLLGKVDASQNPAAWLRTTINRELGNRFPEYISNTAEFTEDTKAAPAHDPMSYARMCRIEENYLIADFATKIRVAEGFDSEIEYLIRNFAETEDYEVMQGIEAAVFALQKARKKFIGEYRILTIGTLRFHPENFSRFAKREG